MFQVVSKPEELVLYRAAAAYVIAAWLLITLIDTLSPLIYVPATVVTIILLLFAGGFAVTILMALDRSTSPQSNAGPEHEAPATNSLGRRDRFLVAGFIIVLALVIYEQIGLSLPANVSNVSWLWVSTTTPEGVIEDAPKKSGVRFDRYTGRVQIWTDCNQASSTYSVSLNRQIVLGRGLMTTAMACLGPGPQDALIGRIGGTIYQTRNGDLFLISRDGLETLRFVRVPEGAGGIAWALLLFLMTALPTLLVRCCALDLAPRSASSRPAATMKLGRLAAGALIIAAAVSFYLEQAGIGSHRVALQEASALRERGISLLP